MTHEPATGTGGVRRPLTVSLAVVVLLATSGSSGAGFGIMTGCTDDYRCSTTVCSPCAAANAWLTGGWIAQGALLLAGVLLAVLAAYRVRLGTLRRAALLLGPLSVLLFALTTVAAVASY